MLLIGLSDSFSASLPPSSATRAANFEAWRGVTDTCKPYKHRGVYLALSDTCRKESGWALTMLSMCGASMVWVASWARCCCLADNSEMYTHGDIAVRTFVHVRMFSFMHTYVEDKKPCRTLLLP